MKYDIPELRQLKYDITVDLYRQHARAIAAKSKGLECFIYKAFGADNIGSLALMLDPYWQFSKRPNPKTKSKVFASVFPITPVPVNRTRTFTAILPFQPMYHEIRFTTVLGDGWQFTGSKWIDVWSSSSTQLAQNGNCASAQLSCTGFVKDTTWKSRNPGVKFTRRSSKSGLQSQGEYELFVPSWKQVPEVNYGMQTSIQLSQTYLGHLNGVDAYSYGKNRAWFSGRLTHPHTSVLDADLKTYSANEKVYATSVMAKNLDMLERCVPTRRYFNLAYQIGELKDIPQTLKGTIQLWIEIERYLSKAGFVSAWTIEKWWTKKRVHQLQPMLGRVGVHVSPDQKLSDAYLNFKFGWESMIQSIGQLVKRPGYVTKEVNYLIDRNGRFTTLASTRGWSEQMAAPPHFSTPFATANWSFDGSFTPSFDAVREIQLRCVANVGVFFPQLSVPSLRSNLFWTKLGLYPTPGDIYDLIPWTWMIDWFVGLGDYIHLMDAVNGDDNLINYGFMSYKSKTTVTGHWRMKTTQGQYRVFPGGSSSESQTVFLNGSPKLELKYELRKSLSSLVNVKTYSGTGLSGYQSSILAALVSKFV